MSTYKEFTSGAFWRVSEKEGRLAPRKGGKRKMEQAAGMIALGASIAIGVSATGAGVGQGIASGKAFESIARQPETAGTIRTLLFIALAFMETLTIYGLLIAFILIGKIPG